MNIFVNEIKHVLITIGPGINISKTNVIEVFNFWDIRWLRQISKLKGMKNENIFMLLKHPRIRDWLIRSGKYYLIYFKQTSIDDFNMTSYFLFWQTSFCILSNLIKRSNSELTLRKMDLGQKARTHLSFLLH